MLRPPLRIFLIALAMAHGLSAAARCEGDTGCFAQKKLPDGRVEAPLDAWIANAGATRAKRAEDAFLAASRGSGFKGLLVSSFAKLWTGTDLEKTNAGLRDILTSTDPEVRREYTLDDKWNLWLAPSLYRIYFHFSKDAKGTRAGRLEPATEAVILDFLWNLAEEKNDIALARMSTWWMTGSENHDLNGKVTSLLTSQIFKSIPGYREKKYSDKGHGAGHSYWFHSMYGGGSDQGPDGEGAYADGVSRGADEHYAAWVAFFKDYIRERARRGFFVEVAASGYMKFTISFILDIRDYCEDPELRDLAGKFLDAIWADWAVDQIDGHRGGAVTRWVDLPKGDAMHDGGRFLLGDYSPAYAAHAWYSLVASDYKLPRAVWALALRRKAMGSFVYESRRPGEENPLVAWERPPGMERSLLCDTDSRLLRYSYITPAYILGTQMDYPGALHSHLSLSSRWQGMLFADGKASRVYPAGFIKKDDGKWAVEKSAYFRSVQSGRALVVQRDRSPAQATPEWFPKYNPPTMETGVEFGALGKDAVEDSGWIFTGSGDAWLAVRPLLADAEVRMPKLGDDKVVKDAQPDTNPLTYAPKENPWHWTDDRKAILLENPNSPVLFQAGLKADFPDRDSFRKHVLAGELQLRKIVVEGFSHVRWSPSAPSPVVIDFPSANGQTPRVNGEYVNFSPPFLLSSPFLNSLFQSGIITIEQGDAKLVLDFNELKGTKP